MAKGIFKHVLIKGIATVVPSNSKTLDEEAELLGGSKNIQKIKKITGLYKRRIADKKTTALDLCCAAARKILKVTNEDIQTIDGLIFVTQTPDYRIPNNASVVHGKLGFNRNCLCYDINHGCSGYVYGLLNAFSLIETGFCQKVLLLVGDTLTKVINPRDKSLAIIHGDAGSATLIARSEKATISHFIFYSEGEKAKSICVEAGGFRNMTSSETSVERVDEDGNIRTLEQLYMNGLAVFNFALEKVPPLVEEILKFAGKTIAEIDLFAFHQANGIINRGIIDKLAIPVSKAPMDVISEYGNGSCATIPHVLSKALGGQKIQRRLVVLTGFGVGLSLASCCTYLDETRILPVIEYENDEESNVSLS